ncbi:MAG: OmpA family protein [Gemmatimonadota bacterium]|nr:OmpA family protein [Gemmatimonadota bacterium]
MRFHVAPVVALIVVAAAAPAVTLGQDAEGSADHPLITRYEGSVIEGYDYSEFDEYTVPTGPVDDEEFPSETVEGEVTRISYQAPEGRSVLEVFRNYERALEAAGFETIFECAGEDECGYNFDFYVYGDHTGPDDLVLPAENASNLRFLSARASKDGRPVYVTLLVGEGWFDGATTRIDVVEAEAMEEDKVAVDPVQMFDSIEATGKAVVNDILFATNSTAIEPASADALAAIATLMRDHPDLEVHVVGHTDATGSIEANMELSRGRAQAVVDALVSEHGIDRGRLVARGVGPLAPVATNRSEEGRSLNRRVELVDLSTE